MCSFVGSGSSNTASAFLSFVGNGSANSASGTNSFVGSGSSNTANGLFAVIPGGVGNVATNYAFAAGYGANASNVGSFVWSSQAMTSSTNAYSFTVRAPGGIRFLSSLSNVGAFLAPNATAWSVLSDRNSKENFQSIDEQQILNRLEKMPVTAWNYKHDPSRRYIGPTAQDFKTAFGLGNDDKSINTLDTLGVTLAAIKGIAKELKVRDQQIIKLRSDLKERDAKMEALEKRLDQVSSRLPPSP